ncbi:MAG TPA: hypothetical protein VLG37_01215 [Candidatus Saccharimonadales bacterium]|nr:hypothetical protein [Candidatus Saccharimonadales bacterium]
MSETGEPSEHIIRDPAKELIELQLRLAALAPGVIAQIGETDPDDPEATARIDRINDACEHISTIFGQIYEAVDTFHGGHPRPTEDISPLFIEPAPDLDVTDSHSSPPAKEDHPGIKVPDYEIEKGIDELLDKFRDNNQRVVNIREFEKHLAPGGRLDESSLKILSELLAARGDRVCFVGGNCLKILRPPEKAGEPRPLDEMEVAEHVTEAQVREDVQWFLATPELRRKGRFSLGNVANFIAPGQKLSKNMHDYLLLHLRELAANQGCLVDRRGGYFDTRSSSAPLQPSPRITDLEDEGLTRRIRSSVGHRPAELPKGSGSW